VEARLPQEWEKKTGGGFIAAARAHYPNTSPNILIGQKKLGSLQWSLQSNSQLSVSFATSTFFDKSTNIILFAVPFSNFPVPI